MTDFQSWYEGIKVRGVNDWNNLLDHGLEKVSSYIVRKWGIYYEAINGSTGKIAFGGSGNIGGVAGNDASAVIHAAIAALTTAGGRVYIKEGIYTCPSTIVVPAYSKNITVTGACGYGKSSQNFGTMLKASIGVNPLFQITPVNDVRSAYAINFDNIKFVGNGNASSVGLKLDNLDTGAIHHCTLLNFGKAITNEYIGTTYPLGEQPGKLFIHHCEFGENQTEDIFFDKATQTFIDSCCFAGFGPFSRNIRLKDTNKIHLANCEFNISSNPATLEEYIKLEGTSSGGGLYPVNGIQITNSWAYRTLETQAFIRTLGTGISIYNVVSKGNIIENGYSPDELTDAGPYVAGDPTHHWLQANDYNAPFSSPVSNLRDKTTLWAKGTDRQNKWSPMIVNYATTLAVGQNFSVRIGKSIADYQYILQGYYNGPSGNECQCFSFHVPSLFYWRVDTAGAQTGQIIEYI